ncbi:radical SAM family heme chaperone HemW [Paenisporosarcina cavernae]|uniref:Heme chaperone HemW n=1 Tax=Paenisporosarcina cavernae TaxID=2320858 RepID=A0A385YTI8_9BACL|nr:radical SAM family heme chaperone HemW [Paenisporosarcina cavernae]AYC29630.1 oxygen-independent coproporphyrinogen III oxidase [Paenisporosarcina cavernae]
MKGIYIHIPFCHQICHYCDFNKVFFDKQPVDDYLKSVLIEIEHTLRENKEPQNLESVFLGGGTPTSLTDQQLGTLLAGIIKLVPNAASLEWTSEANPDELTASKLDILAKYGVNRLSMGVQSFQPHLLQKLGRVHHNEQVFQAISYAKSIGLSNISIDLMYGLPDQTLEEWRETMEIALSLDLPHYSAYSLLVEPKTVFYNLFRKGKLPLPGQDLEATMYAELMRFMEENERYQYEISNFGKENFHSIHNSIYWSNESYAGIGAGAHGYLNGNRYSNIGPIKKYIQAVQSTNNAIHSTHLVTKEESMEEQLFLGLRMTKGVSLREFSEKYTVSLEDVFGETVNDLTNKGLLVRDGDYIQIPPKARFIANEIFSRFLLS